MSKPLFSNKSSIRYSTLAFFLDIYYYLFLRDPFIFIFLSIKYFWVNSYACKCAVMLNINLSRERCSAGFQCQKVCIFSSLFSPKKWLNTGECVRKQICVLWRTWRAGQTLRAILGMIIVTSAIFYLIFEIMHNGLRETIWDYIISVPNYITIVNTLSKFSHKIIILSIYIT